MSPINRVRLAVLLLMVAALLAGTPALAGAPLELTPTGVEPDASGQAKMTGVRIAKKAGDQYPGTASGTLTVTCQGLTPNSPYVVSGPFLGETPDTNSDGMLYAQFWVSCFWPTSPLPIFVLNADGAVVLYGELVYQDNKK